MSGGYLPSAVEFMDHRSLGLVGDLLPFRLRDERAALLIVEVDGAPKQVHRDMELIGDICRRTGAIRLLPAADEREREQIWDVRRQISLRIHDTAALYIPEDVVVPIGRIAELVDALPEFEREYGLLIYTFGHAGDGNIHLNITAASRDSQERAETGVEALLSRVLTMEGTISGEHGIGAAKMRFLPMELSLESIQLQRGIKDLFDPNLVLNPGKIFSHDN
jgi:D-lactate dehydrogenase (cytochrome)